jgi:3-dehydroquinate synthase
LALSSTVWYSDIPPKTLPQDELANGLAESIKYGIIRDKSLFQLIESNIELLKTPDEDLIEEVVFRCASIKAEVVQRDEKDLGLRNILNFGHTTGHAIETVSDFQIAHGKAVAIGMMAAAMISRRMDILSESELKRIRSLIVQAGLPVKIPMLDVRSILRAMKHDKKTAGGKVRFICRKRLGKSFDEVSSTGVVEQVLEELVITTSANFQRSRCDFTARRNGKKKLYRGNYYEEAENLRFNCRRRHRSYQRNRA